MPLTVKKCERGPEIGGSIWNPPPSCWGLRQDSARDQEGGCCSLSLEITVNGVGWTSWRERGNRCISEMVFY